ncbi:hypothetical protein SAMN04488121_10290 [Chitinophaga filiformis]|uniref:Uncharacterized protein n=1 Tax=Chitinophaga filiformis TaxID=104663 RepID=A0A1G7LJJ6_CHIFI|nr:hypothetical protein SAMN04488121_10290 [Chitinophaga filiformis]
MARELLMEVLLNGLEVKAPSKFEYGRTIKYRFGRVS